ncbi:hypothetical protein J0895_03745 [Phormidium pseudopriestleyi FRX01]|uniref:Uncharacterized protein n=1 Tax=Phormidium pseudopriestleyi FRX01 TaxID=1759528 RepID=A0ABS3FM88_9CYAN|nr:hypothetical protein [Phormidium pseudopriestleyi]MBO0348229.1 hypothetical protein [Phormidium pseudopriestleyi FRX01]
MAKAERVAIAIIVQTLSDRAGLPMPELYIVPSQSANAFRGEIDVQVRSND